MKEELSSQYDCMEEILSSGALPKAIFVDFHGESTSEKQLFLHCFASRVSAIVGTHTHVQTHDAMIYRGTAFMADAGDVRRVWVHNRRFRRIRGEQGGKAAWEPVLLQQGRDDAGRGMPHRNR